MRTVPLKRLVDLTPGQSPPSADVVDGAVDGLPFLQGNAEFGHCHPQSIKRCDSALRRAVPGDILLSIRAPVGALNIADQVYGIGRGLCAVRPVDIDQRFCWWLLHALRQDLAAMAVGSTYDAVTGEDVGSLVVPAWPVTRQRAIADYLDTETARIDALIAKKRQIVELIDVAVISRLDEELSAVSNHLPLRRLLMEPPQYGASEVGAHATEGWPRYIRITDLKADGTIRSDDMRYLHPITARPYLLRDGDVLIARSGATVGKAFIYRASMGRSTFAGYLIRFRFDRRLMLPELMAMWTRTAGYWDQIRQNLVQATIENVSAERYKDLLVPVPDPDQQEALVADTESRWGRAGDARSHLSRQILLLQERRQALITAAVTGELVIPGVAA